MKKRFGLDNIIGKRSRLHFFDHVFFPKTELLKFTLPASLAASLPPFSTSITMKKGDPVEYCELFNEQTFDFEEGFPVNSLDIYVQAI